MPASDGFASDLAIVGMCLLPWDDDDRVKDKK